MPRLCVGSGCVVGQVGWDAWLQTTQHDTACLSFRVRDLLSAGGSFDAAIEIATFFLEEAALITSTVGAPWPAPLQLRGACQCMGAGAGKWQRVDGAGVSVVGVPSAALLML